MKKIFFAIIAVLMSAVTVNAQSKCVESVENIAQLDTLTLDYMEAFASRKHHEVMLKVDDKVYWKGRAVEGFFVSAVGGASYNPTSSAFSYVAGVELGYSLWRGDFLVTGRVGEVEFDGLKYIAPSAFAEARLNLAHWGKNKQNRFYVGARVGYQYTESDNSVNESGSTEGGGDYNFSRTSKLTGSGLGYGIVTGWETQKFMTGHRFGVQIAAYTYDRQHSTVGRVNNEVVADKKITKQGWQVEVTLRYSFQFGKVKKSY